MSCVLCSQLLRLSKVGTNHAATGRVVNLMSNDVCRFDYAPTYIGFLIITPVHAVITTYCLWTMVGPSAVVGMGFMLLQTLLVQSELTPCAGTRHDKLTVAQLFKKFQSLRTVFTGPNPHRVKSMPSPTLNLKFLV